MKNTLLTKKLLEQMHFFDFTGYTLIEDAAAELLCNSKDGKTEWERLCFPHLTVLSNVAALSLANCKAGLLLNGLVSMTENIAIALADHKGLLSLDGLVEIPDNVANALAKHEGNLFLSGLKNISDQAAASLAQHKGDIELKGLAYISDTAAKALSKCAFSIELSCLREASDVAIEALASNPRIHFLEKSLENLSANSARALVGRMHDLYLNKVTAISDEVAEILSGNIGDLWLESLTSIPLKGPNAFGNHKGWLSLKGLTTLTEPTSVALAKNKGPLSISGITALSDIAAENLSKHKGLLFLDSLITLSENAADSLGNHKGSLYLNGITTLSDNAMISLAKHNGHLWLNGLKTLSDTGAQALGRHTGELYLDAVSMLSDTAAVALAKHDGHLRLDGVKTLSKFAAEAFLKGNSKMQSSWLSRISASHETDIDNPPLQPKKGFNLTEKFKKKIALAHLKMTTNEIAFTKLQNKLQRTVALLHLPQEKRPLKILETKPKILKKILFDHEDGLEGESDLIAQVSLSRPAGNLWSLHLPWPKAYFDKMEEDGESLSPPQLIKRDFGVVATMGLDVEDFTESDVQPLADFCKRLSAKSKFDMGEPFGDKGNAMILRFGNEAVVVYQNLVGEGDQWEAPPYEISHLLNRVLFPKLAVLYLDFPTGGVFLAVKPVDAIRVAKKISKL